MADTTNTNTNTIPVTFAIGAEATINAQEDINEGRILLARDTGRLFIEGTTKRFGTAGVSTDNGGEVFNDYENNVGGMKGFRILEQSKEPDENSSYGQYTLDSVTGLETGDVFSIRHSGSAIDRGTISNIDKINKIVYVNNYLNEPLITEADAIEANFNSLEEYLKAYPWKNTLSVNKKPNIGTISIGIDAHAEGRNNQALRVCSHAEGNSNIAMGEYSHAEGKETTAIGYVSHAEGAKTKASGTSSHTEGDRTTAEGGASHAEGNGTKAIGYASHAEGSATTASGKHSHAEGHSTTAFGDYSHAEGHSTTASADYSHAEGAATRATGQYSHAEGNVSTASGYSSHAEGEATVASGNHSHAEGKGTIAQGHRSHVQGRYNIVDTEDKYAFIIGNGQDNDNRSNAFTVEWDGNVWCANNINLNYGKTLTTPKIITDNIIPDSQKFGEATPSLGGVNNPWYSLYVKNIILISDNGNQIGLTADELSKLKGLLQS